MHEQVLFQDEYFAKMGFGTSLLQQKLCFFHQNLLLSSLIKALDTFHQNHFFENKIPTTF